MAEHHLKASAETAHWGWFQAGMTPALTIDSGDVVTIDSVSGVPGSLPGEGFHIPPELHEIHERAPRNPIGPHILTGPVAVRGAQPGDVLEIRIRRIGLRQDWGYTLVRPLVGALANETEPGFIFSRVDEAAGTATLPWGTELPLDLFFGVMGVAPPPAWGAISTIQPRAHGGNIDCKELRAGAALFLPVWAEGGLFSVGDGHGRQGDGEVCVTAIETALQGEFEIHLRRDLPFDFPHAETADELIAFGTHYSLDEAARAALRRMLDWIERLTTLTRTEAYMLCSLAADVRVTQMVNQEQGCHVVLPRSALAGVMKP